MQNKTILIISPEAWGENFVSKHHYANYLAKNNTVYFLNPPEGYSKKLRKGIQCHLTQVKKGLYQVAYLNLLPRLNNLPKTIAARIYAKQAAQVHKFLNIEQFDVVWSFDPYRFFDLSVWRAKHTIYHTVDFHPSSKYEKAAVLSADLFLGVTDLILQEHAAYRKGILIPHAADIDGFQKTATVKIPGKNTIRAIYTGNFHRHIDYELLLQLVSQNKEVDFIMLGPTSHSNLASKNVIQEKILADLKALPNIFFLGSVPPDQLMAYLKQCHINLVLFKKENEIIHCSPHKLMAYFYTGHVTISNYIDAHKNTDNSIIHMCTDASDTLGTFLSIKENLNAHNREVLSQKRRNFALENSYEQRINEITEHLSKLNHA
jgi:teichuronic acid biosynthesis glycosyltransferase TuaH